MRRSKSSLSSLFNGTISAPQDSIDDAAKYEVRKYGENCAHHECFEWIDPPLDDDLVDHIDNNRRNEDLANLLPAFTQEGSPLYRLFHDRPEAWRSALSRVHPPAP